MITDGFQVSDFEEIAPTVRCAIKDKLKYGTWYWQVACRNKDNESSIWSATRQFTISPTDRDAIAFDKNMAHPHLFGGKARIEALRRLAKRYPVIQRGVDFTLARAECELKCPVKGEDFARRGRGQHQNYNSFGGICLGRLVDLSFAYLYTSDTRFSDKAIAHLRSYCSFERWVGNLFLDPNHFDPPWHGTLETAMMTCGIATAYDWVYDQLSEQDRILVRTALIEKGIIPLVNDWCNPLTSCKIPRHYPASGNWIMVCAGSAGIGALAVANEDERACQWVRQVRDTVRWWLQYEGGDWMVDIPYAHVGRPKPVDGPLEANFGPDGGYKESTGYMNYAMMFVSQFIAALKESVGIDMSSLVPENILDPVLYTLYSVKYNDVTKYMCSDFGDSGGNTYMPWLNTFLMRYCEHKPARWLYDRTSESPQSVQGLLWFNPEIDPQPPEIRTVGKCFRGISWVTARSSWDDDACVFAMKFHQNRGHHDLGQFYLHAGGSLLLTDSGTTDYGSKVYQQYLSQTHAHNTIRLDGRNQKKTDGHMDLFLTDSCMCLAQGQFRAAYPDELNTWVRTALFIKPGLLIVRDLIELNGRHTVETFLHPDGNIISHNPQNFHFDCGDYHLTGTFAKADGITPTIEDGYFQVRPAKYLRLEHQKQNGLVQFLMAVAVHAKDKPAPKLVWKPSGDDFVLDITYRGYRCLVSTESSNLTGWCISAKDGVKHIASTGTKSLQWEGKTLFESSKPVAIVAECQKQNSYLSFACKQPVQVRFDAGYKIGTVKSSTAKLNFNDSVLSAHLEAGEHEVLCSKHDKIFSREVLAAADTRKVLAESAPAACMGVQAWSQWSMTSPLHACNHNPYTAWHTLPWADLPVDLYFQFPKPKQISKITLRTKGVGSVKLAVASPKTDFVEVGSADNLNCNASSVLTFTKRSVERIRVLLDKPYSENRVMLVEEIRWE